MLASRSEIEVDGIATKVVVEQLEAVDVNRLGDIAGHLAAEEQGHRRSDPHRPTSFDRQQGGTTWMEGRAPSSRWLPVGAHYNEPNG